MSTTVASACGRLAIDPAEYRFPQREARETTGWSDFQVKTHMRKLVEMEYVLVHRGGRGQSFVYELLWRGEGTGGNAFLMGLVDVASLPNDPHAYDVNREHRSGDREHPDIEREQSGSIEGAAGEHGGSAAETMGDASADAGLRYPKPVKREKPYQELERKTPIVRSPRRRSGNGRAEL